MSLYGSTRSVKFLSWRYGPVNQQVLRLRGKGSGGYPKLCLVSWRVSDGTLSSFFIPPLSAVVHIYVSFLFLCSLVPFSSILKLIPSFPFPVLFKSFFSLILYRYFAFFLPLLILFFDYICYFIFCLEFLYFKAIPSIYSLLLFLI